MRISLFQPSNAVRENVIFKALAGPSETDLHQRGFDQDPVMVALILNLLGLGVLSSFCGLMLVLVV
jgi:hypothetical protein